MLKLSSNSFLPIGEVSDWDAKILRITEQVENVCGNEGRKCLLIRSGASEIPPNFGSYLFLEKPSVVPPRNSFLLDGALSYLREGDIVKINPKRNAIRVLYRKQSPHNAFLLTERCNNFCLMCSQPPKDVDDGYIVEDIMQIIPLMSLETKEICLTGGEPTLLGKDLVRIVATLKENLPATAVHILSNGRTFKDWDYAKSIGDLDHPDLMIGIPVYSDISSLHDHVVQADGAFDETIRGILNLKSVGVKVEIRVVLHKLTYERLPDLARFIRRNLTFCDHITFMGLEMTGFTRLNLEKLWIDPVDYQSQLKEAVNLLAQSKMNVSIYNHQLCLLDPSLVAFNRKSISDWKKEFMPECERCSRKNECGGFFSSAKLRYSSRIKPFQAFPTAVEPQFA